ncbi:hypothetical protein G7054_g1368 [Neopestalotiopsis clavispora]|nr:hypothetical protein G7054_g1368 [Neopestalotiopsis clavispora]
MPRKNNSKGKRKSGRPTGSPHWNQQSSRLNPSISSYNPLSSFAPSSASTTPRGHTLADEARTTSKRPRGFFGQDAKLRHRPVVFVKGGFMDPMKELNIPQMEVPAEAKQDGTPVEEHTMPPIPVEEADAASPNQEAEEEPSPGLPDALAELDTGNSPLPELFVIDTTGDKSLRAKTLYKAPILPRPESDHDSDSSEEVILFRGRDPTLRSAAHSHRASPKPEAVKDSIELREIDAQIRIVEKTITHDTINQATIVESARTVDTDILQREEEPVIHDDVVASEPEPSQLDALLDVTVSDEEAALVADYIANMKDDDSEFEGEDDDEADAHPGLGSHAFHLLRDLGGSDSDAVPKPNAEEDSDEDESNDEEGGEGEEGEANADSETSAARRRKVEREDERLARMLAKQEELGFGGDDLILYDDVGEEEDDDGGDWQIAPRTTPRSKKKKKSSTKQAKIFQKKGQYPSATAMAEAFDDLDLMDWHRAALNNVEQAAKRASRPPEHSDSELEEAMNMAWKKDRLKKAEKKKQREALRAQGLLGKNVNPDDLRTKYQVGMSRDELVLELEQFVIGSEAHHLKIKSQSSGTGDNRHPVLYRTARTLAYEERMFENIVDRVFRRQYFTRVDVDTNVAKAARAGLRKDTSGMKRNDNAVSYREGEVVGQHARELASDNKGRMLLEKMGWAKGMALGTVDNKGIMVPVAHVMKKSRLGLGEI